MVKNKDETKIIFLHSHPSSGSIQVLYSFSPIPPPTMQRRAMSGYESLHNSFYLLLMPPHAVPLHQTEGCHSHGIQSFMNCSSMASSCRLQFFKNWLRMGLFYAVILLGTDFPEWIPHGLWFLPGACSCMCSRRLHFPSEQVHLLQHRIILGQ